MNVACGACPAKYVIPDEKVLGRKVRIPCKRCGAAIIIDGTSTAAISVNVGSPSDDQVPPAAFAPVPRAGEKPKSAPVANVETRVGTLSNADRPPVAHQQAVRPQRAIRQTIIGVAAPANAPESAPVRPVPIRRPTPIYVRSPNVTTQAAPIPPEQPTTTAPGKVRSLRRTMLGGLDGDESGADGPATGLPNAPKAETLPIAGPVTKVRSRDIKQTIIGGLEAPAGSAPGADGTRKRPIPKQDTPPGTWMAILTDGKTLRITENELPRALSKNFVNADTLFWRSGMSGWLPLREVSVLKSHVNRSSVQPLPKTQATGSRAPNPAPKAQPSQPAPVPSFSRPPIAARLPAPNAAASNRSGGSTRVTASTVASQLESSPFTPSAAKMSRGPASVSARSSSPTLELVELDDDDDIAKLVSSRSTSSTTSSDRLDELHRLAASGNSASQRSGSNAPSGGPAKPVAPTTTKSSQPNLTSDASAGVQQTIEIPPPIARRRKSKVPRILLVTCLFVAGLLASCIARQPRPLYDYFHKRGWDRGFDAISKPSLKPFHR